MPSELRIVNYELRIMNYELRIVNYELRITNSRMIANILAFSHSCILALKKSK